MELYPICDETYQVSPYIWYALSGNGEQPSMRVGHCMVHVQNSKDPRSKGYVYCVGGANPSGCFNDLFSLDLQTLYWLKLNEKSNLPRACYEHAAFVDSKSTMYVFGGSCETGNLNETLKYENDKWNVIMFDSNKSKVPSSRTQHVGCVFRDQLVVFGGGESGPNAVNDQNVYVFNPMTESWSLVQIVSKQKPSLRHGHLLVSYADKYMYLHGGMHDNEFLNDLWLLNLDAFTWSCVSKSSNKKSDGQPCARAAHGGLCTDKYFYIYGGLDKDQVALNEFWKFDVKANVWSTVTIFGDNPPPRLDYAFCKLKLNIARKADASADQKDPIGNQTDFETCISKVINVFDSINPVDENEFVVKNNQVALGHKTSTLEPKIPDESESQPTASRNDFEEKEFFLIHGGMDTLGNIFDDCFIINLPE
jgi:hypothetical protein